MAETKHANAFSSWCTKSTFQYSLLFLSLFSLLLNVVLFALSPHYYTMMIEKHFRKLSQNGRLRLPPAIALRNNPKTKSLNPTRSPVQTNQKIPTKTSHSPCPVMTIHQQEQGNSFKEMACRPRLPTEASCKYTAKAFNASPSISICKDQLYELCTIAEQKINSTTPAFLVKCDLSACDKGKDVSIEDIDPSNGKLRKHKVGKEVTDTIIQNLVQDVAQVARKNGFNFVFLNCVGTRNKNNISQLLTLLQRLELARGQGRSQSDKLNINVVLLDSISRAHFYRSLPTTVEYLRRKQSDLQFEAHAFEFELFQAIHGHTHENEHALFSGQLYPTNFTKKQIARAPTNAEVLFGVFKRAGYQTMFMEDLCWKGYYGLIESLKGGGWKSFQKKLKKSNIDSTGITESSCKILNRYGSNTQFYDNKNHQICFNGKHHHQYLFDYLARYIKTVDKTPQSKPLFSFMALNVAHDHLGVRVQTLDKYLMNFIHVMSKEKNTMTIIYADHGNTYTYYQVKMIEGRLEMYHPMMLAVIPKELGRKLGEKVISNLRTNQHRLFNLFDVRAGLVELSKHDGRSKLKPTGIFGEISKKRTCDDLALTKASICICDGWYIPVVNSTTQMAIAEFAIGQLNNKIQELLMVSRKDNELPRHILFGACQRLRLQSFENMRQRTTPERRLSTTMDVKVQSANILKQDELITINVESNEKSDGPSLEMKLVSFNRISTYGPYKECADPNVELQLCICNKKDSSLPNTPRTFTKPETPLTKDHSIYGIVGTSSNIRALKPCLFLIHRSFTGKNKQDKSVKMKVYEIANICNDSNFMVTFDAIEANNIRSSINLPTVVTLQSRTIYFIAALKTEKDHLQAKLNLRLRIAIN